MTQKEKARMKQTLETCCKQDIELDKKFGPVWALGAIIFAYKACIISYDEYQEFRERFAFSMEDKETQLTARKKSFKG